MTAHAPLDLYEVGRLSIQTKVQRGGGSNQAAHGVPTLERVAGGRGVLFRGERSRYHVDGCRGGGRGGVFD